MAANLSFCYVCTEEGDFHVTDDVDNLKEWFYFENVSGVKFIAAGKDFCLAAVSKGANHANSVVIIQKNEDGIYSELSLMDNDPFGIDEVLFVSASEQAAFVATTVKKVDKENFPETA